VIGDRREEVLRLAKGHGAYNVRVFGLVAPAKPQGIATLISS
jgi:hypothetical protein